MFFGVYFVSMKLRRIHQKLSVADKRSVKDALISPFFNKNPKIRLVWDVLERSEQRSDDEFKLAVHRKIFGRTEYDDLVIRHLMSKLQKLVEQVLAVMHWQSEPINTELAYVAKLNQIGEVKTLKQQLSKVKQQTDNTSISSYKDTFELQQLKQLAANKYQIRYDNAVLQDVSDSLDSYYVLQKLKMAAAALSLQTVYSSTFNIGYIDTILTDLEENEPKDSLILLYYLGLQTLRSTDSETYFKRLKVLLSLDDLSIDTKEQLDLFILAQNYCIRKVNSGERQYFEELFELYQASLKKNLIQTDQVQFPPTFKNIVSVALRLKAFDWVERFIISHTEYLSIEYRDDYLNYNLARLYFELNELEQARDHLLKVMYKDLFIGLNARMLMVKTYYELNLFDLAYASIESFQQYLNRKEVLSYHKQNYKNNLKFVKRLLNLNRYDKARKKLLRQQIQEMQMLTEKNWLLQKLTELGG